FLSLQAQTVTVDLTSLAPSTIEVNYTSQGSFPLDTWNNQVLTITWPDVGAGGPGNAVSIAVSSSNSVWFFNTQGGVSCDGTLCEQKVISSSNNVTVDLSTTISVATLSVSGTGSDNTTYSISGASGDLFVNHVIFGNVGLPGTSVQLMPSLPVELLAFEAKLMDDSRVRLDWQTASELNNDFFQIERSADGQTFETIGVLAGAGTSAAEISYESWDEAPLPGINYYRLKQVDFDGSFVYSEVRVIKLISAENALSIFPNPTTDWLTLQFAEEVKQGQLQLFNSAGQLVLQRSLEQDNDHLHLQLRQLEVGMYWLKIEADGQIHGRRVVLSKE
ncbi:MAG: T9SS type A sorting domain-containing protein, partial [Bacteroidota bacterium]